ncbi:CHAT domain-containing protein [Aequorivita sp. SDUM287046]|uniref:CHAT domain-containing protein n=1 Tax=Aequorivita aurantiaca TaxID=3053356 RepID=A0ABT8DIR1_9FLAO|nr:CHAT domain-containing protein [Aequorivita aurantiaca]MDN3723846.1 CHAT domain-containing protein [Aequorivita aurantiaca]
MKVLKLDISPFENRNFYEHNYIFRDWVENACYNSEIYIDAGTEMNLVAGDFLSTVYKTPLMDVNGNIFGEKTEDDDNLLYVVEVFPNYCITKFRSFAFQKYFDKYLPVKLNRLGRNAEFMQLFPIEINQEVILVPREEKDDWLAVDELYGSISNNEKPSRADLDLYKRILMGTENYIAKYKNQKCFFLSSAYFQRGFTLNKLGKFEDSSNAFREYIKLFPNGVSVEGAYSWINRNNYEISNYLETKKTKILFLSANPMDSNRLRLDKEISQIDKQLQLAQLRNTFELVQKWALSPAELQQVLLDHNPDFVHFSGHGLIDGIVLEGEDGKPKNVATSALANIFKILAGNIACVVLNACYSSNQAIAIKNHVPYVVGMTKAMPDDAAIAFSVGFYKGIGAGRTIETAFALGVNAIELEGCSGSSLPILL